MSWESFAAAREDSLRALSPPILSALGRHDTPSPIFHGCFDWHSAVHGVYSLYAIHHRTSEALYLEAAAQHARPELIEGELRYMASDVRDVENPYGFSWVLQLVMRQESTTGTGELRPLAEHAARRVAEWVSGLDESSAFEHAMVDRHRNLSFALLHLAAWGRYTDDAGLLDLAGSAARRWLLSSRLDEALPVSVDVGDVEEFMPPALMRLGAVGGVLGAEQASFIRQRLPEGFRVPPLVAPRTGHAAGVNFFRAFALLHMYRATGLTSLRDDAARLVLYQLGRPDLWRSGSYDRRHWIAQIGVRVLDDSYDVEPAAVTAPPSGRWPAAR